MRGLRTIALAALVVLFPTAASYAQAGRGGAPPTPKAASPTDFTGYWVSVVTEDWLYRMVTPAKGDYSSVPLNPEGRKVADAWDPRNCHHIYQIHAGEHCGRSGRGPERVPAKIPRDLLHFFESSSLTTVKC